MTKKERNESFKKFIKMYGKGAQLGVAQEECAELIQAISKYFRNKPNAKEMIIEELADVKVMTDQLIYMFNCEKEVEELIDSKIQRQMERYKKEEIRRESLWDKLKLKVSCYLMKVIS